MKNIFVPASILVAVFLLCTAFISLQNTGKQKAKGGTSGFAGTWRGSESCQTASAPVAYLVIADSGPSALTLSGIYSIQGKITATVNHDTITIPIQEVKDPNFTNLMIEGKLIVSGKTPIIRGNIAVMNNQTKDECTVQFQK